MIKTRFAPSPTGFLHVGGARTALYSWLFAQQAKIKNPPAAFLLRIEDTDQIRSTAESAAGILTDLQWLGLNWDEGPTVGGTKNDYFQSMRLDLYNKHLAELVGKNLAYEAYETPQQLAAMRAAADKEKRPFRYRRKMAGRILAAQPGVEPVLRFEMPFKDITVHDLILGDVTVKAEEHDDIIIRKSGGFPTFHFAVVVDDHSMGVTHVLRAQEHLMNTFKHLGLYEALGWAPPHFGHLPLVFNMDNTKMSKREKAKVTRVEMVRIEFAKAAYKVSEAGWDVRMTFWKDLIDATGLAEKVIREFLQKKSDSVDIAVKIATYLGIRLPEIDVQDFRKSGYLPEALLNFIALVGWAPGKDREIMSLDEMLELFSLDGIQKTPGRFDRKKLEWMNGEYIRKSTLPRLLDAFASFNEVADTPLKSAGKEMLGELLAMYQERMVTLGEMAENARFFFEEPVMDAKAVDRHIQHNNGLEFLKQSLAILAPIGAEKWNKVDLAGPMEEILALGMNAIGANGKRGAAAQPIRVAISGNAVTPPLLETLALLGREKTVGRMERAMKL